MMTEVRTVFGWGLEGGGGSWKEDPGKFLER